jgi:hypothetical protein
MRLEELDELREVVGPPPAVELEDRLARLALVGEVGIAAAFVELDRHLGLLDLEWQAVPAEHVNEPLGLLDLQLTIMLNRG